MKSGLFKKSPQKSNSSGADYTFNPDAKNLVADGIRQPSQAPSDPLDVLVSQIRDNKSLSGHNLRLQAASPKEQPNGHPSVVPRNSGI